jgi:ribosomal protein L24
MMENEYAQFFQDFKDNEQKKAEKNISDIERNIMVQNLRLQDEAQLQEEELKYLEDKNIVVEQ